MKVSLPVKILLSSNAANFEFILGTVQGLLAISIDVTFENVENQCNLPCNAWLLYYNIVNAVLLKSCNAGEQTYSKCT